MEQETGIHPSPFSSLNLQIEGSFQTSEISFQLIGTELTAIAYPTVQTTVIAGVYKLFGGKQYVCRVMT